MGLCPSQGEGHGPRDPNTMPKYKPRVADLTPATAQRKMVRGKGLSRQGLGPQRSGREEHPVSKGDGLGLGPRRRPHGGIKSVCGGGGVRGAVVGQARQVQGPTELCGLWHWQQALQTAVQSPHGSQVPSGWWRSSYAHHSSPSSGSKSGLLFNPAQLREQGQVQVPVQGPSTSAHCAFESQDCILSREGQGLGWGLVSKMW